MFVDHGQAADNRDALARALYGIVFNFIVAQRNFSVTKNLFFSDCPHSAI
jgi:myosin heavy subunit